MSTSTKARGVAIRKQIALALLPRRRLDDREFLAPALQIIETPPCPIRMALAGVIFALVGVSLAWGYFGRIDIVATAQGKVQPIGRVKVVQPLETGAISRILVTNGSHVHMGDPLIVLDAAEPTAEAQAARLGLQSARAEVTRRKAAAAAAAVQPLAAPAIAWSDGVPPDLRLREDRVVIADFNQLAASIATLEAQRSQKRAEADQLGTTMATQLHLIDTLQQRVAMRTELLKVNAGTKAALIDAMETLQYQTTQLALQKGQLVATQSEEAVFAKQIEKACQDFIADNAQKLGAAERQAGDFGQSVAKAEAKLSRLTLIAPIDGVVQASIATNPGQVLSSGQEVLRLVPDGAALETQVYVLNRDIGFVSVGQEAAIKVEAFPFTRYGIIKAHVTRVASDAIPEPDAAQIEGDPVKAPNSIGLSGAQRMQNLVFPVWLSLDATSIPVGGRDVSLVPGMTVTADLEIGRRRFLEYLFSPLLELGAEAMHER